MDKVQKLFNTRRFSEFKPVIGLYIDESIEQFFNKFDVSLVSFFDSISICNLQFSNSFRILNLNQIKNNSTSLSLPEKIEKYIYQKTQSFLTSDFVESFSFYNELTSKIEKYKLNLKEEFITTEWSNHILSLLYKSPRLEQFDTNAQQYSGLSFYDLPRHILTITLKTPDLDSIFQALPTFENDKNEYAQNMTNLYMDFDENGQFTIYQLIDEREILFKGSLNDLQSEDSQNYFDLFDEFFFYEKHLPKLKPLPGPLFQFLTKFTKSIKAKLKDSVLNAIKKTNDDIQLSSNQGIKHFFTSREKRAELKLNINYKTLRTAFDYLSINQFKEANEILSKLPPQLTFYSNFITYHFFLHDQNNTEIFENLHDGLIRLLTSDLCTSEIAMYLMMKTVDFVTIFMPSIPNLNKLYSLLLMPEWGKYNGDDYIKNNKQILIKCENGFRRVYQGVGFSVLKSICLERMALSILSKDTFKYRKSAFYFHLIPIIYNQSPLQYKSNNIQSNAIESCDHNSNSNKQIHQYIETYDEDICGHSLFSCCMVNKLLTLHLNPNNLFIVGEDNVEILTNDSNQINQIYRKLPWQNLIDISLEKVADMLKDINQTKFVPLIYLNLFALMESDTLKNQMMISFFDCYNRKPIDKNLLKRTTLPFLQVTDISFTEYGTAAYYGYNSNSFDLLHDFWLSRNKKTSFSSIWVKNKDEIHHISCNKPIKLKITVKCISKEVPLLVEDFTIDPIVYNTKVNNTAVDNNAALTTTKSNSIEFNDSTIHASLTKSTSLTLNHTNSIESNSIPNNTTYVNIDSNNPVDEMSFIRKNSIECESTPLHFNNSKKNGNIQIASIDFKAKNSMMFDIQYLKFSFWGLSDMRICFDKKKLLFEAHKSQPFVKVSCCDFPKVLSNGEIGECSFEIKNDGDALANNVALIYLQTREMSFSFATSSKVKNKYLYPLSTSSYAILPIADVLHKGEIIYLKAKLIGTKNKRKFNFSFFYLAPDPIWWRYVDLSFDVEPKKSASFQNAIMADPRDTSKMIAFSNINIDDHLKFTIKEAIVGQRLLTYDGQNESINSNSIIPNNTSNDLESKNESNHAETSLNPDINNNQVNESNLLNQSQASNSLQIEENLISTTNSSNQIQSNTTSLIGHKVSFILTESNSNSQPNSMFMNPNQMIGKVKYEALMNNQTPINFESFIYKNQFTSLPFSFQFIDVPNEIKLNNQKSISIPITIFIIHKSLKNSSDSKVLVTSHFFPKGSGAYWVGKEENKSLDVGVDGIQFCFQLFVTRPGIIDLASALRVKIGLVDSAFPFSHYIRII